MKVLVAAALLLKDALAIWDQTCLRLRAPNDCHLLSDQFSFFHTALCGLNYRCTQWVLNKDTGSVFTLREWRMDSQPPGQT